MFETGKFHILGNNAAIDLVNTKIAVDGEPVELLINFDDLVGWSLACGILDLPEAKRRSAKWSNSGDQAFRDALEFRTILHRMLTDVAQGNEVRSDSLSTINKFLRETTGFSTVARGEGGFEKQYHPEFIDPRQILSVVAESAADLLSFGDLSLVRKCEDPECVLFFYDTTKNHRRRWCSMAACGNRAKAKAFYQRKKAA